MNSDHIVAIACERIEWIYSELLLRPQFLVNLGPIEPCILALELVLDTLSGSTERRDSYTTYLRECGFGMHVFDTKFAVKHDSIVTFRIGRHTGLTDEEANLISQYRQEFADHLQMFLEWRRSRST
jgi:hypothetical protein